MKKFLSFLIGAAIFLMSFSQASAGTFYDVDESQKYYAGIEFLAKTGIVQGHPDGSYKPKDVLNRAEMIKIIAEGIAKRDSWPKNTFDDYANKNCFNDVKAGQWYTKYVCYGKEQGWVVGYENGKYFKPAQNVSFVEALKITFKGFEASYDESPDPWFLDLVNTASSQNFIPYDVTGFNNGLRRDQMADMITRMIKSEEGQAALNSYLGSRADIVVTYESLQQGLDLSELDVETKTTNDIESKTYTIKITSSGFSPGTLTIKSGDTVTFVSEDMEDGHWPASNVHPTHTAYPGSDIKKCNTSEAGKIFDACKGLGYKAKYSFTFTEKGTWGYHDHLESDMGGTIIVE